MNKSIIIRYNNCYDYTRHKMGWRMIQVAELKRSSAHILRTSENTAFSGSLSIIVYFFETLYNTDYIITPETNRCDEVARPAGERKWGNSADQFSFTLQLIQQTIQTNDEVPGLKHLLIQSAFLQANYYNYSR